jgi:NDP-sugar pyrophosphorylase family protein
MQAVILAGGKGSRLGALAAGLPKPLVDVGGKPFLLYWIETLHRFGIVDIVLLVGPFAELYESRLGDGAPFGVRLTLIPEEPPADTAGALRYAASILEPYFLLLNGDSFFDFDLVDLTVRPMAGRWLARLALREVDDVTRFGAVTLAGDRVVGFGEKAASGRGFINAGVYWLNREVLESIGPPPVSLERQLLPKLVAEGLVRGVVYSGSFIDIGTPGDLARGRLLMPQFAKRPSAPNS